MKEQPFQRDRTGLTCEPHDVQQGTVLLVAQSSPKHKYRLGEKWVEGSPEEDLGVLVNGKLDMTWQSALVAQKAKHVLDCVKSSKAREGTLPLYSNPHLDYCIQLWSPHMRQPWTCWSEFREGSQWKLSSVKTG